MEKGTLEPSINKPQSTVASDVEEQDAYAHGFALAALIASLMLGMFLVALDNVSSSTWY